MGQLYNGQPWKALIAFALPPGILYAAALSGIPILAQTLLLGLAAAWIWGLADAAISAFGQRRVSRPHLFQRPRSYVLAIAAAWIVDSAVVGSMVVRIVSVTEGGMVPAIGFGDRVAVDLTAYWRDEPRRGDIAVFRSPLGGRQTKVSRIIGLPGETIEIDAKQVRINGKPLAANWGIHSDPTIRQPATGSPWRDYLPPLRVPAGNYFVLDDNRDVGFDSRHWQRTVGREQLEGRVAVYAFARHPSGGIRWERIGHAVHRDVPLPADAPAHVLAAMTGAPSLPRIVAWALAIVFGSVAIGLPLLRSRRHAAESPLAEAVDAVPESPPAAAPACSAAAPRCAGSAAAPPIDLARLQALATLATQPPAGYAEMLAAVLRDLAIRNASHAELRLVATSLDRIATATTGEDLALRGLLRWRQAQTLQRLAPLDSAPSLLDRSVAAYRAAIADTPHEDTRLRRAAMRNDLGTALQHQGERIGDPQILDEAIATYEEALRDRGSDQAPLDWATTQHNLGNALRLRSEHDRDDARLRASIAAYEAALTRRTARRDPIGHAMTLNNLGVARRALGERRNDPREIEQATRHHQAAYDLLQRHAPDYAAVPEANVHEDEELLARLRGAAGPRQSPLLPSATASA